MAAAGAIAGTLAGFLSGTVTHVGPGIGVLGYLLGLVGGVAAIGLLPGVLQSLVLRPRVETLAWSAAHLTAVGAGVVVAFPVMLVVAGAVAGLLWGAAFGMVTWRVLDAVLMNQPGARAASIRPDAATG